MIRPWWRLLPVVTRRERCWQILLRTIVLAAYVIPPIVIALDAFNVVRLVSSVRTLGVPISPYMLAFLGLLLAYLIVRRQLRKSLIAGHEIARSGQVRICPRCEYNLHGLTERAQCPECGVWYGPESLRADWDDIYERLHQRARGR